MELKRKLSLLDVVSVMDRKKAALVALQSCRFACPRSTSSPELERMDGGYCALSLRLERQRKESLRWKAAVIQQLRIFFHEPLLSAALQRDSLDQFCVQPDTVETRSPPSFKKSDHGGSSSISLLFFSFAVIMRPSFDAPFLVDLIPGANVGPRRG